MTPSILREEEELSAHLPIISCHSKAETVAVLSTWLDPTLLFFFDKAIIECHIYTVRLK